MSDKLTPEETYTPEVQNLVNDVIKEATIAHPNSPLNKVDVLARITKIMKENYGDMNHEAPLTLHLLKQSIVAFLDYKLTNP